MPAPSLIEEICPEYIGEERITLSLDPSISPRAFQSLLLEIDYSLCDPEGGAVLPLELLVQGPSPSSFRRRVITRSRPAEIVVTPREGGRHLVVLREMAHNRFHGKIAFDVAGETLTKPRLP
jgi:hypothetical protein